MKKIIIVFLFCFLQGLKAQESILLSDSAQISLLTCAPGNEIYTLFGHSGIRVKDFANKMDVVFNYGTFSFGQPDFVYNFCKGNMIYALGVEPYSMFEQLYQEEERSVFEQKLILSTPEKQRIFDFLYKNALPENRDYRYDFLFDNCSTRIRDVFEKCIDGKLIYAIQHYVPTKTFRNLINEYGKSLCWYDFGMDMMIGVPVDKIASFREQQFLPDYLMYGFEGAIIERKNGSRQPFCGATQTVLNYPAKTTEMFFTPTRCFLFLLVCIVFVTFWEIKKQSHYKVIDLLLYFLAGVLGILFLVMWFWTIHSTTHFNLNLLWAFPLHLFSCVLLFMRPSRFKKYYFLIAFLGTFIFVFGNYFLPQHFNVGLISIGVIYLIRNFLNFKRCEL